ncbi:MAG TPA: superoxide dismutase family protein [Sphingobium sp.]|uniref:superoxide dismutase family protein n=1 Tax=Sphingobium sp. TaxID=1912891 RepID=UPI002ED17773
MPKRSLTPLLTLCALAALGSGSMLVAQANHHHGGGKPLAWATLHNAEGKDAGSVKLFAGTDGMIHGVADVTGISPGAHGIHLHTTGKCDAPAFTTAGGHLNPENKQHGLENPMGAHEGDLPNLLVGADGKGHGTFMVHATEAALFDADGTAVVVHAAPDDNKTDPSGNSGARILCGVLERPSK